MILCFHLLMTAVLLFGMYYTDSYNNLIIIKSLMEPIEKKDMLNLNNDSFVRSILLNNGISHHNHITSPVEEVYLSCLLQKYNSFGMKQQRTLLITNLHLFNLSKQSKSYNH